jgi:hypothetical protein
MATQPEFQATAPRQANRVSLMLDVGLRRSAAQKAKVALRDISTHGFRAEIFERIFPDERLWLKLPGLEGWQARVAWVRGDEIGCEFVQPLHPAVLNIIVMKAGATLSR